MLLRRAWLHKVITNALNDVAPPDRPRISDWSLPPVLPPWLSADVRDAVSRELRDAVRTAEPLGRDRATHFELLGLRDGARLSRGTAQIGPLAGVAYEAPLLDDHVAEAVLAVRREDRDTPVEWKPMMKAAMKGLLPDDFLRRTTKVGGSAQSVRGFAAHLPEFRTLLESSGLADSGLIDMTALADTTRPDPKAMPPQHIHKALNAAVFLRNQAAGRELGEDEGDMIGGKR